MKKYYAKDLFTISEYARRMGKHRQNVHAQLKDGKLTGVKCQGVTLIYAPELNK